MGKKKMMLYVFFGGSIETNGESLQLFIPCNPYTFVLSHYGVRHYHTLDEKMT